MSRCTAGAAALALGFVLTQASPSLAFEEIPLATTPGVIESSDGSGQSSVALPGGGFAVLWLARSFDGSSLQMQWLDENGEIVFESGGRTLVSSGVGNGTVIANPAGGVFVAHGGTFGSGDGVKVQSYDAAGVAQWPGDGVLASSIFDTQHSSALVADGSGGVFACFSFMFAQDIRCQHLDSAGKLLWAVEGLVPSDDAGPHFRPRVLSDEAGGLMVFWRKQTAANNGPVATMVMKGQRFDGAGNRQWGNEGLLVAETFLTDTNSFRQDFYDLIGDGAGGAVLAFDAFPSAGAANQGVVAQRVSAAGALMWGSGAVVVADSTSTQHRTSIDPHDGGIIVVTSEDVAEVQTNLRIFRLGSDGDHLWPEAGTVLSDPASTGNNLSPRGTFDDGLLRITWSYQLPDEMFEIDVALARFSAAGLRLEPLTEVVTEAAVIQVGSAVVYSSETGQTLIVWDDQRSNNFEDVDVYAVIVPNEGLFSDGFESGDTTRWSTF